MGLLNATVACCFFAVLDLQAYEMEKVLDSISIAESGGRPQVGDRGMSVSSYQIWLPTWNYINTIRAKQTLQTHPYSKYPLETVARAMARTYCEHLSSQYELHNNGRKPSAEVLYLLYTMGFSGAQRCGFAVRNAPSVKQKGVARFVSHYYGK